MKFKQGEDLFRYVSFYVYNIQINRLFMSRFVDMLKI